MTYEVGQSVLEKALEIAKRDGPISDSYIKQVLVCNDGLHGDPMKSSFQWNAARRLAAELYEVRRRIADLQARSET